MNFSIFCQFLLIFVENIVSYKVLVYNPAFGASHSNFLGKISDILIDGGHDVTMLIPVFMEDKKELVGSKKVKKIIRLEQDPRIQKLQNESNAKSIMREKIWTTKSDISFFFSIIHNFSISLGYMCEDLLKKDALLENLKNEKFDLGISESMFHCGFVLFDNIGIKTTIIADSIISSNSVKYAIGEPSSISYYPAILSSSGEMNLIGRVKNVMTNGFTTIFNKIRMNQEFQMIQNVTKNVKDWKEYFNNAAFVMVNSNQYIDYPSAVLPKTVFVGGMQVTTKQNQKNKIELEEKWNQILEKRKTNILISFGSNAFSSDMPQSFKSAFIEVFKSMPHISFIWKYEIENSTIIDGLDNVYLTKWMPQNDILADDRLTLFITHGGLGSSVELAYQGKPAIVIPLMADQPRNAHMLHRHGGVVLLGKERLAYSEDIRNAILTIINDSKYKKNAEKLANILASQPHDPKEIVLKYCNFAVQFGSLKSLNSIGKDMNFLQFYNIDIFIYFLIILFIFYKILCFIFRLISSFYCKFSSKAKTD